MPVGAGRAAIDRHCLGIVARHCVGAGRDVVKNAGAGGRAGGSAARSGLRGEFIKNVVRVALARRGFLIDQRHDSGEGRGGRRRAAHTQELEVLRILIAVNTIGLVSLANDVKAAGVKSARSVERDIGDIAFAVAGHCRSRSARTAWRNLPSNCWHPGRHSWCRRFSRPRRRQ